MSTMITKTLAIGLTSLMLAAPLWAQDTGTEAGAETEAQTDAPAEGEGTDVNALDMGQVVGGEREAGTTYTAEVYGDWERKCTSNPEGEDPCHLYQLLKDSTGQATAEINMLTLPAGSQAAAGATVIVPLQTLLTQQLTIAIDGGQTKRYPFKFCTQIGCIAQIGLTNDEVGAFKRGAAATVTIVPAGAPDQRVTLNMSLSGFTDGFNALPIPSAP